KEAKEVQARIAKLDFRIKVKPFAGRKAKSDRVVLVELFTAAHAKPCVAADMAFDALGKSYKPSEVVLLQYHLHIPAPDPLTSPDAVARQESYGRAVRGMPTIFFNGKAGPGGGGDKDEAGEKYEEYRDEIDPLLEKQAGAAIKLTAKQKGSKITIDADV